MSKTITDTASPLKAGKPSATSSAEPVVKAAASRRKRALPERSETATPKAKSASEAKPKSRKSSPAKPPKAEKSSAKSRVAGPKDGQTKDGEGKIKDRFTMPASDHALISALKKRAKAAGRPVKKSELLRAGLHALNLLDETQLLQAVARLQPTAKG
jgi:hypothetical protein